MFLSPPPRIHLERSAVVLTTRACWLASVPPTGEYGRKAWQRMTTTMKIQTQTPAPQGRTPTARAAPSPDCLDGAGLEARPELKRQGDLFFVFFAVEEKNHRGECNGYVSGFSKSRNQASAVWIDGRRSGSTLDTMTTNHWSNVGKFNLQRCIWSYFCS